MQSLSPPDPFFTFEMTQYTVAEGGSTVMVCVLLSRSPSPGLESAATVTLSTADGTAGTSLYAHK